MAGLQPRQGLAVISLASLRSNFQSDAVDTHRSLDVFQPQFAKIVEDNVELADHLLENTGGNEDAARLSERLKPRGNIYSIAEDVSLFDNNIAQVDSSAILDATLSGNVRFSFRDGSLNSHCTLKRINDTGKLHQQAIASRLDNASAALIQNRINALLAVKSLPREGSGFVGFHVPRKANHIERQNGREPSHHPVVELSQLFPQNARHRKLRFQWDGVHGKEGARKVTSALLPVT